MGRSKLDPDFRNEQLARRIDAQIALVGLPGGRQDLAARCGINYRTLNRRMKDGQWTLPQLRVVLRTLRFKDEDKLEMLKE